MRATPNQCSLPPTTQAVRRRLLYSRHWKFVCQFGEARLQELWNANGSLTYPPESAPGLTLGLGSFEEAGIGK